MAQERREKRGKTLMFALVVASRNSETARHPRRKITAINKSVQDFAL
jgi:hypothetical protein